VFPGRPRLLLGTVSTALKAVSVPAVTIGPRAD